MLRKRLKNKKVILASQSPRRKELMKGLDIDFTILVKPGIDENLPFDIPPIKAAEYLARQKAFAYINEISEDVILISSDTIVLLDDEILGKPKNYSSALNMLTKLSGRKHQVITGVCIKTKHKDKCFSDTTSVYFKNITKNEIDYYVNKYKPYDKAGAYGIQEWIGYTCIEKIEGSYFNVVGFPVQKVYKALLEIDL